MSFVDRLSEWITNCSHETFLYSYSHRPEFMESDPKATACYTSSELKNMGMVGVYRLRSAADVLKGK